MEDGKMKALLNEVRASVLMEYERASTKFGAANNSNHESYAVILEEFEEAIDAADRFKNNLDYFWSGAKGNHETELLNQRLEWMRTHAEQSAAEWIQVAAMCYKAERSDKK